jgi:hypothetical protein
MTFFFTARNSRILKGLGRKVKDYSRKQINRLIKPLIGLYPKQQVAGKSIVELHMSPADKNS